MLALKRFGGTWWGKAWIQALERRARLDPNRLPRGRTYARQSRVGELTVKPGGVTAGVSGSRPTPYIVRLGVRELTSDQWDALFDVIAARAGHAAALLDGELAPGVADDAAAAGTDLLPGPGDLTTRCSCPDWAEPCKHAAAVCYLVADVLDADPFALLLLRGRSRDQVLAGIRARRGTGGRSAVGGDRASIASAAADHGVVARDAFAAAAGRNDGSRPALPSVPVPPPHPGEPTPIALDPPPGCAVTRDDLIALATDAARRAWELSTGDSDGGLSLELDADLARRTANLMRGGAAGGSAVDRLARRAGVPTRQLHRLGATWAVAGARGVAVSEDRWSPPDGTMEEARVALASTGAAVAVRHNRVSVVRGTRQLRFGRDEQWYRFDRGESGWELVDGPSPDAATLLDRP